MANSVSKINVHVGANTSQLTAGMNQAAATVQSGMGRVQGAAQQATYAIDDFMAGFSTGGVAGGLRGASNNLSMLAAGLGGIKTQLAVIGVMSAAQLLASHWQKQKEQIDATRDALALYREELTRVSGRIGRNADFRSKLRDIGSIQTVEEAFERQQEGKFAATNIEEQQAENVARIEELQAALDKEKTWKKSKARHEGLNASETDAEIDARIKVIAEELAERKKVGRTLKEELEDQRRINDEVDKHLKMLQGLQKQHGAKFQPFITNEMRSQMAGAVQDIDQQLAELRAGMRPSLSMADMFRMLPGANAMGSSGAIGAINSAIAGPQNARDSGPALHRETNTILKRIEDLERKKKGILEVISL